MREVDRILADFTTANSKRDSYVSQKIQDVRGWFDEVGKGGRGKWTFEKAQDNLRTSIGKLENVLNTDGTGFGS